MKVFDFFKSLFSSKSTFSYRYALPNRLNKSRFLKGGSADDHINERRLHALRESARNLDRNNPIASAILDRATEAVISKGVDIQITSGNKRWDDRAEKLFKQWWDTEADARGLLSGFEIEKLAFRSKHVDGDILFIKTGEGKLQAIEGDRVYSPIKTETKNIVNGVELDEIGKPIAFYVADRPEHSKSLKGKIKFKRIKAEDCFFLSNVKRFGQTRGITSFATNMQLFDDIDAYIETCVVGSKVSVSHVLFIQRENGIPDSLETQQIIDENGVMYEEKEVNPGSILYGKPGEKASMIGSNQTMVQFSPFVTQLLRLAGLPFGLPLEMVGLDFSKTNYSSARASLLVAHRSFRSQHKEFMNRLMIPIIKWKLLEWIKAGLLEERKDYKISATPPKSLSLDPLKESNAEQIRVKNSFTTLKEICASQNQDYQEILNQRAKEIIEAGRQAEKISKATGEDFNWRELMGATKDFNSDIYETEDAIATSSK